MIEFIIDQALDFLHEFLRRVLYRTVLKRAAPEPKAKHPERGKAAPRAVERRKRRGASAGQMLFNIVLIVAAALILRRLLRRRGPA